MHHSSVSHTQDARRDLQSISGVPAGTEGRGIGMSVDQNIASIAGPSNLYDTTR